MAAETIRGKVDHDKDIHEVPKYHSTDYCENTWEGKHILTRGQSAVTTLTKLSNLASLMVDNQQRE